VIARRQISIVEMHRRPTGQGRVATQSRARFTNL
jgi:hypothetical protein